MSLSLLYIEDDEIDVLALKRVLKGLKNVKLSVVGTLAKLKMLDTSEYDVAISDVNLPDGGKDEISSVVSGVLPVFWVSGNADKDELAKPLTIEQLTDILNRLKVVDLAYIKDLADGDEECELEMVEIAIKLLPQRLEAIKQAATNIELQQAAHKTKSSFRVCGIQSKELEILDSSEIEDLPKKQVQLLVDKVESTINRALKELNQLLN